MMVRIYCIFNGGGKTDHQLHHLADNEKVSAFFSRPIAASYERIASWLVVLNRSAVLLKKSESECKSQQDKNGFLAEGSQQQYWQKEYDEAYLKHIFYLLKFRII